MQNCRSGAKIKHTTPRATPMSPNLRAHAKQIILNLEFDVFDDVIALAERHLNNISRNAMAWHKTGRSHSSRNHLPPASVKPLDPQVSLKRSEVVCTTRLGGLLKAASEYTIREGEGPMVPSQRGRLVELFNNRSRATSKYENHFVVDERKLEICLAKPLQNILTVRN